jgi:hypothetical protein
VLNQAENYPFFAAAVLFNVVIRGIQGGTREVSHSGVSTSAPRIISHATKTFTRTFARFRGHRWP